jgi:hypothetical protein
MTKGVKGIKKKKSKNELLKLTQVNYVLKGIKKKKSKNELLKFQKLHKKRTFFGHL